MYTYVVFLRGINVGGHKKIPMADLKLQLRKLEFSDVQTYIQSGNIIVKSNLYKEAVEKLIGGCIKKHFNFDVPIFVFNKSEFSSILNSCPFEQPLKAQSYFVLLKEKPKRRLINSTQKYATENELFYISSLCIYVYYKNGYGRSKYNTQFFENALKVISTARNYRTMFKMLTLLEQQVQ